MQLEKVMLSNGAGALPPPAFWIVDADNTGHIMGTVCVNDEQDYLADLFAAAHETAEELEQVKTELAETELNRKETVARLRESIHIGAQNKALIAEMLETLEMMMKAHKELLPGIGAIACQSYQIINDAPVMAASVIKKAKEK